MAQALYLFGCKVKLMSHNPQIVMDTSVKWNLLDGKRDLPYISPRRMRSMRKMDMFLSNK